MKLSNAAFILACLISPAALVSAQEPPAPARPQYSVEQVFRQWDKNGDGKLTPEEAPGEQLLKMLDKNGDGKLDRSELPAALFDRFDVNKDGFVTEEELKALWKAR